MAAPPDVLHIQSLDPGTAKPVAGDIRSIAGANSAYYQHIELAGGGPAVAIVLPLGNGSAALGTFLLDSAGVPVHPPFPVIGSLGATQLGVWSVTVGNDQLRVASGGLLPVLLTQTSGRIPVQIDATSGRVPVELANSGDVRVHSGGTIPVAQTGAWTVTLGASSGDVPVTGQVRVTSGGTLPIAPVASWTVAATSGGTLPVLLVQTSGRVPVQLDASSGAFRVELASSGDMRVHSGGTLPMFLAQTSGRVAVQLDQVSGGVLPVSIVSGTLQSTNSVYATQIGSWQVIITSGGVIPVGVVSGTIITTESVFATQQGSWQVRITSGGVIPVGVVSGTIITTESVYATQQGSWHVRVTSGGTIPVTVVGGGASDGAVLDGADGTIKARVFSLAGGNPQAVTFVTPAGSLTAPTSLGGTFVGSVTVTPAASWTMAVTSGGTLPVSIVGGTTGDGALQDGSDNTIEARVFSLAGGNPLAVVLVTPAGSLTAPTSLGALAAQQGSWTVTLGATSGDVPVTGQVRVTSGGILPVVGSMQATQAGAWTVTIGATSGRVPVQIDASSGAFLIAAAVSWTVGITSGGTIPVTPIGSWTVGVLSAGTLPVFLTQTSGRVPVQLDATSGRIAVQVDASSGAFQVSQSGSWDMRARGAALHDAAWPDYPFPLAGYAFAGSSRAAVTSGDVVGLLADLEGRLRVKVDSTDGVLPTFLTQTSGRVPVQLDATSGDVPVTGQVRVTSGGILPVTPAASWTVAATSGGTLPVLLVQTSGRVPVQIDASSGAFLIAAAVSWTMGVTSGGTLPVTPSGSWTVGVLSAGTLPVFVAQTSGRVPVELGATSGSLPIAPVASWTVGVTSGGVLPVTPAGSWTIAATSGGTLPVAPAASWTVGVTSGGILPVVLAQTSGRVPVQLDATSGNLPSAQAGSWQVRITSGDTIPVTFVGGITGSVQATQQGSWVQTIGAVRRLEFTTFAQTVARAGSLTIVGSGLEWFGTTRLLFATGSIGAAALVCSITVRYAHAVTSGTWLFEQVEAVSTAGLFEYSALGPYARLVFSAPASDCFVQGAWYGQPTR